MDELNRCVEVILDQGVLLNGSLVIGLTIAALWLLFHVRGMIEKRMSQPQCQLIYKFRR